LPPLNLITWNCPSTLQIKKPQGQIIAVARDHRKDEKAYIRRKPKSSPCVLPTKTKDVHKAFGPPADCLFALVPQDITTHIPMGNWSKCVMIGMDTTNECDFLSLTPS